MVTRLALQAVVNSLVLILRVRDMDRKACETAWRLCAVLAVVLILLAGLAGAVRAAEVWTPEVGEVDLNEPVAEGDEAAFRHAWALVGAGRYESGVAALRRLSKKSADPAIAERARYAVAQARHLQGKYKKAFKELERFVKDYPRSARTVEARWLQVRAAQKLSERRPRAALELLEKLGKVPDLTLAARVQKDRADAMLKLGRYLAARDEYLALVDYYPRSKWVPYCFYKAAECELGLASWIGLGSERFRRARRELREFITSYPLHELASNAREKLAEARSKEAARIKGVARFYLEDKNRPEAAVAYLRYLRSELRGTEGAKWAEATLQRIEQRRGVSLVGRDILPGVVPKRARSH